MRNFGIVSNVDFKCLFSLFYCFFYGYLIYLIYSSILLLICIVALGDLQLFTSYNDTISTLKILLGIYFAKCTCEVNFYNAWKCRYLYLCPYCIWWLFYRIYTCKYLFVKRFHHFFLSSFYHRIALALVRYLQCDNFQFQVFYLSFKISSSGAGTSVDLDKRLFSSLSLIRVERLNFTVIE